MTPSALLMVVLAAAPAARVRTETRPMMGTTVTVTLVGGTAEKAREGFDAAFGAFERVNQVIAYSGQGEHPFQLKPSSRSGRW